MMIICNDTFTVVMVLGLITCTHVSSGLNSCGESATLNTLQDLFMALW